MTNKLAEATGKLAASSQVFNEIAGKDQNYSYDAIRKQFEILKSEFQELSNGICYNDVEEVLDGLVDCQVVLTGLMQQLESAGIDVVAACERIADNNLTKYVKYLQEANASVEYYKEKGIDVKVSYNPKYGAYMLKDSADKIRKPVTFKDVYIQDLIPSELLLKGFPTVQ